jgi:hypothetical protein
LIELKGLSRLARGRGERPGEECVALGKRVEASMQVCIVVYSLKNLYTKLYTAIKRLDRQVYHRCNIRECIECIVFWKRVHFHLNYSRGGFPKKLYTLYTLYTGG